MLQETLAPTDVIVCAAGSLPGDLHKLWRARDPKGYHLEYGYSCMGYEIAGGLGVKMAAPDRDVYVLVGDGSYLMMAQEIVTAVQEGIDDHDRPARQPRLREHRRPVGVGRQRRLRHALPRTATRRRASSTATCCRSISPPTPRRSARASWRADDARRVPRGARRSPRRTAAVRHRRAGRSRGARRRLRLVVGCAGRRGVDDAATCRTRARRTTPRGARSATFCDPRRQRALLVGRARIRNDRRPRRRPRRCSTRWPPPATPAPSWATGDSCRPSPQALAADVPQPRLALVGAFVPVALRAPRRIDEGLERAVRHGASAGARRPARPTPRSLVLLRRQRERPEPHRARRAHPRAKTA